MTRSNPKIERWQAASTTRDSGFLIKIVVGIVLFLVLDAGLFIESVYAQERAGEPSLSTEDDDSWDDEDQQVDEKVGEPSLTTEEDDFYRPALPGCPNCASVTGQISLMTEDDEVTVGGAETDADNIASTPTAEPSLVSEDQDIDEAYSEIGMIEPPEPEL